MSEWAAQELVVALAVSHQRAETELERALTLVQRLPGTLAALQAGALHAGHLFPLLDIVAPIAGYRPGAELDRYLRARDRRCRFPGCRRRVPKGGELDHHIRHPDGPTAATNLAGYCTTDHRCKHRAPGWTFDLAPDATLTVTTSTGLAASTTPPPY